MKRTTNPDECAKELTNDFLSFLEKGVPNDVMASHMASYFAKRVKGYIDENMQGFIDADQISYWDRVEKACKNKT